MTPTPALHLKSRLARWAVLVSAAVALLCIPTPASAQLFRVGASLLTLQPGGVMRGTDTAYDPAHGVFLTVVGNGPVYGVFLNAAGTPVSAPFAIMLNDSATWAHFPRVEYSAQVPNGAGGQGGFLVTWNHNLGNTNYVFGRTVSYNPAGAGRVVSNIELISDGEQLGNWHETGPAMAYSPTSGRFLVAWRTLQYGIRGRFVTPGGVPTGVAFQLENAGQSRDPALTWNPGTNEFGLGSTGFGGSGAFAAFRRIRASDGFVSGRTSFGFGAGTFATAIDVNGAHQYVFAWAVHPGTMTATFDSAGNLLATNFITDRLGFDQSLGLAYNPASGTFLAVSSDRDSAEVGAVEISGNGLPNSIAQIVTDGGNPNGGGSYHPLTAARPGTNQWNVVYSQNFLGATNQFLATTTTGGGSGTLPPPPPPPTGGGSASGCSTPDPFVSIGGGTCINGGWIPGGGSATPPPPPPPAAPAPAPPSGSAGCSGSDPFASIGGGTCVNGGWIPGRSAPAPPPSAPAPAPPVGSGCSTPNPFASLGGGVCVNGNWVLSSSGGCSGSDPFASIGGGSCVNGGWIPGGGGGSGPSAPPPPPTAAGCSGSDPFVTTGGGACVNGGWMPASIACTGPDPFVSIGGGVCINRGWVPR